MNDNEIYALRLRLNDLLDKVQAIGSPHYDDLPDLEYKILKQIIRMDVALETVNQELGEIICQLNQL